MAFYTKSFGRQASSPRFEISSSLTLSRSVAQLSPVLGAKGQIRPKFFAPCFVRLPDGTAERLRHEAKTYAPGQSPPPVANMLKQKSLTSRM